MKKKTKLSAFLQLACKCRNLILLETRFLRKNASVYCFSFFNLSFDLNHTFKWQSFTIK